MTKLLLEPDQTSYSAQPGEDTVSIDLAGGRARYRRTMLGAADQVSVKWVLEPFEYQYLTAFRRTVRGGLPFQIDLVLDGPIPQEYTARFVPGTYQLDGIAGTAHIVSAKLDVDPLETFDELDATFVELFASAGADTPQVIYQLELFVNVHLGVL